MIIFLWGSTFLSSKLESIPFLDEAPPPPPPISGDCEPPNTTAASQLGLLGSPPTQMGLLPTPTFDGQPWKGLINLAGVKSGDIPKSYQGLLPTPGTFPKLYSGEKDVDKVKKGKFESFGTRKEEGKNNFNLVLSPMDMEMSSPEGDIIDRLNEEFWKQQKQNQSSVKKTKQEKPKETFVERAVINKQSLFEEPYEPESGLIITEEFEEDLNNITDPKERRRRQKEQQKEKTKVQVWCKIVSNLSIIPSMMKRLMNTSPSCKSQAAQAHDARSFVFFTSLCKRLFFLYLYANGQGMKRDIFNAGIYLLLHNNQV